VRTPLVAVTLSVAVPLASGRVAAQDAQQWTYGYGPVGQFTAGTIVGGVDDLSAVYYNPATLSLMQEPRFLLGLNTAEISKVDAPGAAGQGLDLDTTVFHLRPGMLAGRLGTNRGQADHFAWALLSRYDMDWDLEVSAETIGAAGGSAGFGRVRERMLEYWGGLAWSHRLQPRLAFGVTTFLAYRLQRNRRMLSLTDVGEAASQQSFVARENEYDHGRVLAKGALAWRPGAWELGAAVTSPGLRLYDRGKALFQASLSGPSTPPLLSASTQDGLSATYHAPWSVAAGATRRFPRRAIHASVEWFSSVAPYDILTPQDAPVAGEDRTIPLAYRGGAQSVLDYGAGLEQRIGEQVTLYLGAAYNGSSWLKDADTFASWNLTHLTAGVSVRSPSRHARLAAGLGYAWGDGPLPPPVSSPFTQPLPAARSRFWQLTGSLGAIFHAGE